MSDIKTGDRVEYTGDFTPSLKGATGTVVRVYEDHEDVVADVTWDSSYSSASGTRIVFARNVTLLDEPLADWEKELLASARSQEFDRKVRQLFHEAAELLLRKHRDYGPGNIAGAPGGALNGLRVRLYDKLARLNNLIDSDREPEFETLVDTLMDIGNYGLIGVLVERGDWPTLEKQ